MGDTLIPNFDNQIAVAVGGRRPCHQAVAESTRIYNVTGTTGNIITTASSIQLVNDSSLNGQGLGGLTNWKN